MAKSEQMFVSLDLGTTKTCVLVGVQGEQGLEIVGVGTAPSAGLRKGVVVNLDSTVESIRLAVTEAEKICGQKIKVVQTGIAGSHLQGMNSHGIIGVKDREVSPSDVEQVLDAARAVAIPMDREVIDTIPQQFFLDDQEGVVDPIGMSGVRLEVDVHIVTASAASLQNIYRCCNRAGLDVRGIVLQQLASSLAVLTAEERELGVVLVDIGGGTTDIAVFVEGAITHTASLPLGGNQVSNDIAIGLRTPMEAAEKIKRQYGCTTTHIVDQDESIEVPSVGGRPPRKLPRQILGEIIEPRIEEIFELANRELHKSGVYDQVVSGVVVTGGSALLPGTAELAEKVFELQSRVGFPDARGSGFEAVNSPVFATAIGLLKYAVQEPNSGRRGQGFKGMEVGSFFSKLGAWLKDFF